MKALFILLAIVFFSCKKNKQDQDVSPATTSYVISGFSKDHGDFNVDIQSTSPCGIDGSTVTQKNTFGKYEMGFDAKYANNENCTFQNGSTVQITADKDSISIVLYQNGKLLDSVFYPKKANCLYTLTVQ